MPKAFGLPRRTSRPDGRPVTAYVTGSSPPLAAGSTCVSPRAIVTSFSAPNCGTALYPMNKLGCAPGAAFCSRHSISVFRPTARNGVSKSDSMLKYTTSALVGILIHQTKRHLSARHVQRDAVHREVVSQSFRPRLVHGPRHRSRRRTFRLSARIPTRCRFGFVTSFSSSDARRTATVEPSTEHTSGRPVTRSQSGSRSKVLFGRISSRRLAS